ncbi:MAG: hypothetical protein FJ148_08765 [Deltaproteobacteria bacterium]|nr:hypothetical protein [Deltaproteobacteria bacterium]
MTPASVARGAVVTSAPAVPSWRTTLLVVTGYVLLTAWWLWPLPAHMADHLVYPVGGSPFIAADVQLIVWALAWDTHALLTSPLSLFDANVFHPAPLSLAFSEHFLGYVPLFAPTWLVTGNPVLAANAVIVLTFPLCALAAYALARRFVAPPAAFVAGALFAFHGARYANLYHLHQLGTFWTPLALLFTERWLERARARDAVALAFAVGLQLLSSFYLGYAIVLLYGAYLPVALLRWRDRLDRRRLVGIAVGLVAGGVPALVASLPYLELQRLGLVPSGRSARVDLVLGSAFTTARIRAYLATLGVGPTVYALGALALVADWRRGGVYARVVAIVAIATGLLFASGPEIPLFGRAWWSPYEILFRYLPGFSAVRLPFRFLFLAQLGFSLLAALGLAVLLRRLPARAAWPASIAAVGLVLATGGARPAHPLQPQTVAATPPPAYRWLAANAQDGALLELPLIGVVVAGERMVLSTHHWRPLIEAYSAYPPLTRRFLLRLCVQLPAQHALQELVDHVDLRWVLVHVDRKRPEMMDRWLQTSIPGLRLVQRWGDDLLFEVTLDVVHDRRELLLRTDRTLGGLPQRPVGESCPGRIEAVPRVADAPVATRRPVATRLRIVNDGPAPLPGAGLYPRHLVQLRSTLRRNGRRLGVPEVFPIWVDVPAGQAIETGVDLQAVREPGSYEFDLELVQDHDSLARCGMRGTRMVVTAADVAPGRSTEIDPHPPVESASADPP